MYLVFDVGGTFVKYAVMSEDGGIAEKGKMPTKNRKDDTLDDFIVSLVDIYEGMRPKYQLFGIAIGVPGQVDVDKGIVYRGGSLPFLDRVPIASMISAKCGNIPVSVENDARCAALAEVWQGNAKDCSDACVMVFGTGIGGGIIINRRVHRGRRLMAGELSFLIDSMTRQQLEQINKIKDDPEGWYDKTHFPTMFASTCATGSGLIRRVSREKNIPYEDISGELIYKWADAGDEICINALEDVYYGIARQCVNVFVTMDPDIILIGGGISAEPAFINGIKKYVDMLTGLFKEVKGIRVEKCKFGSDSNLIGALFNFLQLHNLAE